MRVYHFLSATNALKDISKRRIKIAQFQDLNDPFELLAPIYPTSLCGRRLEHLKK